MKINEQKLDEIMLELGHRDSVKGTEYIRIGVALYDRDIAMVKELYPAIAKAASTTPIRVERAMRHSIATAWDRGSMDAQQRYFGYTVSPGKGVPTVREYLARIARVCGEN
jgi:two-component system response regulator (stage 0 sporulation protein A)